ncbi:hypothetical protein FHL15_001045 [Xylaria flabelliformis]|uniref:Uncharacterized protein n=1 Tax=Xylaria flabelliformis TaxID=2512241 RepID=A0A553ICA9_9PEZI|nr:hypothetical protein FHL15_001045 [Xylaria flabelliformis]
MDASDRAVRKISNLERASLALARRPLQILEQVEDSPRDGEDKQVPTYFTVELRVTAPIVGTKPSQFHRAIFLMNGGDRMARGATGNISRGQPSGHRAESWRKDYDWTGNLQGERPAARAERFAGEAGTLRDPLSTISAPHRRKTPVCCKQEHEHRPIKPPPEVMSPTTCIDQLGGKVGRALLTWYRYLIGNTQAQRQTNGKSQLFSSPFLHAKSRTEATYPGLRRSLKKRIAAEIDGRIETDSHSGFVRSHRRIEHNTDRTGSDTDRHHSSSETTTTNLDFVSSDVTDERQAREPH